MLWSSLQNGRSKTLPDSRMQSQSLESQRIAESVLTAMSRLQATMLRSSITQNLYKKKPEWEFAGIYADDGISGTNTKKREDFNRMIDDCKAGNIDMIITKSISRFARNTLDCLKYIRQLKDKNIPVFFEKEAINTMDAKGEVLITIMASLAQQVNHNHFLGYTKDADENLIIDPEQAEVVKRIYREYREGIFYIHKPELS